MQEFHHQFELLEDLMNKELNQINETLLSGIEDEIDILKRQENHLSEEIEENRKYELELEKCVLELSTLHSQWFSELQKLEEIKLKKSINYI